MDPQPIVKANPNAGGGTSLQSILNHIVEADLPEVVLGLVLSCVAAIFLAELYKRFSNSVSNHDAFARLFPLLTITTTIVIFVVKSSLALSLGLVGALSIVRFRAAIKEPEELMYLFMCIAMGLAFGANRPLFAVVGLLFFTFIVTIYQFAFRKKRKHGLILTVIAATEPLFQEVWDHVETTLKQKCESYALQRVDLDDSHFQLSAAVQLTDTEEIPGLLDSIKKTGCQVSCLNLDKTF